MSVDSETVNSKLVKSAKAYPYIMELGIFIIYLVFIRICYKMLSKLIVRLLFWYKHKIEGKHTGIRLGNYELVNAKMQLTFVKVLLKLIKYIIFVIIIIFTLPVFFYFDPRTKELVTELYSYVSTPLLGILVGIVKMIPNLIIIVLILYAVKYIVKFLKYLADEIKSGKMRIRGFYPEWAMPTYNLSKVFIYILTLTIVSPYLPGAGSPAFKGISIFAGLLISLGSSTYIGNAIAGFILTYMRSFKVGDRIEVNDITGDVVEKSMLVTRIKTVKNERVTVPNAAILSGHIINYTYSAEKYSLILHTTITIGYDVDWRKVHQLLIKSAKDIEFVETTPEPFVLQKSLDDFYVAYEINAYTKHEKKKLKIMSDLHANIQDNFHAAGVEIMSPHYRVTRNNEDIAIPEKFLETTEEKNKK